MSRGGRDVIVIGAGGSSAGIVIGLLIGLLLVALLFGGLGGGGRGWPWRWWLPKWKMPSLGGGGSDVYIPPPVSDPWKDEPPVWTFSDLHFLLLTNFKDPYNSKAAEILLWKFPNAEKVDIETATRDLNRIGQHLILVGGSSRLWEEADWLFDFRDKPGFKIYKPEWQPGIRFVKVTGTLTGRSFWLLETPGGQYDCSHADYGFVCVAWDRQLERFVIIVIGYSGWATLYGAHLIVEKGYIPTTAPYYYVYRLLEHPDNIDAPFDHYRGRIVEANYEVGD